MTFGLKIFNNREPADDAGALRYGYFLQSK